MIDGIDELFSTYGSLGAEMEIGLIHFAGEGVSCTSATNEQGSDYDGYIVDKHLTGPEDQDFLNAELENYDDDLTECWTPG